MAWVQRNTALTGPALNVNFIVQHPATRRLNSTSHELFIATDDGLYRSFNGGREWAKIVLPDPSNAEFNDSPAAVIGDLAFDWVAYDPLDNTIIYARGTKASISRMWIYKSSDDGLNWISRGIITA